MVISLRARMARERLIEIRADRRRDRAAPRPRRRGIARGAAGSGRRPATLLATFAGLPIGDALKALFAPEDGLIWEWADHLGLAADARDQIAEPAPRASSAGPAR